MTQARVEFVGGPAHGATIDRPRKATVNVPTPSLGQFTYTLRRCRGAGGDLVEVLAPAGRDIDRAWLAARGLRN
ncbi:hypothetical protein QA633_39685 [Bradyrhizobium barranii]|uniref:hypothetical protein n=1 Tax=Bradyrhizobium barranii TaxID=2992140 RepID=UPI0024AF0ED6|nr:hypothetical protein [Bradyrhizobium barranii]WFT94331.1 hypothetical protein QA633_39685 [Bradyrhizobium barranii]